MSQPTQPRFQLPPVPTTTVQKGARWWYAEPSSEQVAAWFETVPLDEGMEHAHYVGGVVLISQTVKVKYQTPAGSTDRHELQFTPYVQIGTRVGYARRLAEHRGLIYVAGPVAVPRSENPSSPYFNANMPTGLWWHCVNDGGVMSRYLCATYEVAFYEKDDWFNSEDPKPVLSGVGTKQVYGGPDDSALMKCQSGAIGRALGVAGILVIGSGVASAEDMQEALSASPPPAVALPAVPTAVPGSPAGAGSEDPEALRSSVMSLFTQLQEQNAAQAAEFNAWWKERREVEGWQGLEQVPVEGLRGIVGRLQTHIDAGPAADAPAPDAT